MAATTTSGPKAPAPSGFSTVSSMINYIISGARARGLDPAAVLSVAQQEGLYATSPGDQGTSFGPFQLHFGGAYPASAPQTEASAQAWASSPAGINYALDRIAAVAKGTSGPQAISSIVSGFEHPADVPGEISRAGGNYAQWQAAIGPGGLTMTAPAPGGRIGLTSGGISSQSGAGVGGVVSAVSSAVDATKSVGSFLGKLSDPSFWLRVLQMLAGAVLAGTGVYLLAKQVGLAVPRPPMAQLAEAVA